MERLQIIVYAAPRGVNYLFTVPPQMGSEHDLRNDQFADIGNERDPVEQHFDGPSTVGMWVWDGAVRVFEEGHERGPEFVGEWRKLSLDEMALTCAGREWPNPRALAADVGASPS